MMKTFVPCLFWWPLLYAGNVYAQPAAVKK